MLIDATMFPGAPDMCLQIKNACAQLGAINYPAGATIDARGFTGNQVCLAANATTMLSSCASGSGHNGGKLLLGNVNLYADGPTAGVTGHYNDGNGSGDGQNPIGTPARKPDSYCLCTREQGEGAFCRRYTQAQPAFDRVFRSPVISKITAFSTQRSALSP
jgi:hypothetical protein